MWSWKYLTCEVVMSLIGFDLIRNGLFKIKNVFPARGRSKTLDHAYIFKPLNTKCFYCQGMFLLFYVDCLY